MAFEMMELTVETLDGQRIPGATYSWTVPAGVKVDVSSPKPHLIQADQVGEYKVTVSFGQGETCELKTELSGRPCQVFTDGNCNTAPVKIDTTAEPNANIPNLAVGDVFNAGDYEVTVTSLKKGSQTLGWTGEGMVEQNLITGVKIPMSVVFKNIKINSCYQYYNRGENGAVVHSKVDASWGSVVDLGLGEDPVAEFINRFISIQEEITSKLEIGEPTSADSTFFASRLSEIIDLRTRILISTIDLEVKNTLVDQLNSLQDFVNCSTHTGSSPTARKSAYQGICSLNPWVALAKCLGAASLDILGSYAFKWVELNLSGTSKAFFDFAGITSKMECTGVLSSATVCCVFSVIPIPTGKTAIAAMVGGAGLSAAEAFSANVLSQYSLLRNSYSNPKTILEKIKWEESFKEAGSSGVITFISTVLIRGGSHGTVLALKNRIVNIAEKKGSDYVRAKLISLGFTDDFIDKIFVKWGVKGDLARGLLPNSKVLLKKSFNSTDFASAPKLPITIVQKAGKTFAQSAEELIADLFEKKGMKKLESKIGGDNGFDILLVDNISNPKQVIVIEVKSSISSTHSASMNNPVNACAGTNEPQMSWCWINDVIRRMLLPSSPTIVKNNGDKLQLFLKNGGTIERYVVSTLNPSGESKIIGL